MKFEILDILGHEEAPGVQIIFGLLFASRPLLEHIFNLKRCKKILLYVVVFLYLYKSQFRPEMAYFAIIWLKQLNYNFRGVTEFNIFTFSFSIIFATDTTLQTASLFYLYFHDNYELHSLFHSLQIFTFMTRHNTSTKSNHTDNLRVANVKKKSYFQKF